MADYESLNDELITRFVCPKLLIDKYYQNMLFVRSGILFSLVFYLRFIYERSSTSTKKGSIERMAKKQREFLLGTGRCTNIKRKLIYKLTCILGKRRYEFNVVHRRCVFLLGYRLYANSVTQFKMIYALRLNLCARNLISIDS
jgi:hypothetical protein